ncbi:MAG: hypothetical protein LUQ50_04005, partial [Methanospirillum sp.]|uniref:hypothetical protein n=1 Tax=Methanospirillum sp. TaxID=45200 RepID=UPI00236FC919
DPARFSRTTHPLNEDLTKNNNNYNNRTGREDHTATTCPHDHITLYTWISRSSESTRNRNHRD